jgi:hypothetical protein
MVLIFLVLALGGWGCIHGTAPQRLATPAPIAAALLVDRPDGAEPVPADVHDRLALELEKRNLDARLVEPAALGNTRNTRQRLAQLARESDAPWLLLLETRVAYYDLLQGRFRWIVYARATLARREDPASASEAEFEVPVFLAYDHEKEPEALREAARVLAERTAALIDNVLAGRP